jgi:hypothetical protein
VVRGFVLAEILGVPSGTARRWTTPGFGSCLIAYGLTVCGAVVLTKLDRLTHRILDLLELVGRFKPHGGELESSPTR